MVTIALNRFVVASLMLNAAGCKFDVTPAAVEPMPPSTNTGTIFWSPPASKGQLVGMGQRADAGDRASTDADVRDAGAQPDPSTARAGSEARSEGRGGAGGQAAEQARTAAAGSGNAAGSPAVEPDAGTNSSCRTGRYDGTFEGSVTFLQGSLSGIKGSIRALLTLDATGDYARISQGMVSGVNDQGAKMNAGWTGALNCKTGQLENAELTNGTWDNGSMFSGTLMGTYSSATQSLSGTWQVRSNELVWAGGNGTWNMQHSPAQ